MAICKKCKNWMFKENPSGYCTACEKALNILPQSFLQEKCHDGTEENNMWMKTPISRDLLFQMSTLAIKINRSKEQNMRGERREDLTIKLEKWYSYIDDKMRGVAAFGATSLSMYFQNKIENSIIETPTLGKTSNRSGLFIPNIAYDHEDSKLAASILAEHYKHAGFDVSLSFDYVTISWGCEQDKQDDEARSAELKARIDNVKSAKIISTLIEDTNWNNKYSVIHTIRLTYQDDKKALITIQENDPFVQAIINKIEN